MPRTKKQTAKDKIGHKTRVAKLKKDNPDFFNEIGSIGGNLTTTKFTSESARAAINKRWEKYRLDQLNKAKGEMNETTKHETVESTR